MRNALSLGSWLTIVAVMGILFIASTMVATTSNQSRDHSKRVDDVSVYIAKSELENSIFKNNTTPLHSAAIEGKNNVVRALLGQGQDVNARDVNGTTPLHGAALEGNVEVGKILINHGADVNARDENGNTPLFMASFHEHDGMIQLLLIHGGRD